MTLRVRDAFGLTQSMDQMFENLWARPGSVLAGASLALPVDIEETGDGYVVRASLPGFSPEDVDVTIAGDTLTIKAERKAYQDDQSRTYLLKERRFDKVMRTITLPVMVDANGAEAHYENGELILTLPKDEALRPRQIPVITGGQPALQTVEHEAITASNS